MSLKIYFCINMLLLMSYLLFVSAKSLSFKFNLLVGHRSWIRLGQGLIFLSIVAPICFQSLPRQEMPKLKWGAFLVPSEEVSGALRAQKIQDVVYQVENIENANVEKNFLLTAFNWILDFSNIEKVLVYFYILGLLVAFSIFCRNAFNIHKILKASLKLHSIGRVRVALSDEVSIPFSVFFGNRRWVILPVRMIENKSDFRLALKHELQHHRQNDTLWAIVVEVLLCFFFPNPAMYLWKREIIELQEFSCDEALLGQKGISSRDYGSCLVRVAEAALENRQMHVGTTCMAMISKNPKHHTSFLRRRIEMLTSHERPRSYRSVGIIMGTLTATLTMAFAYGAEQALREQSPDGVNPGTVVVDPAVQSIAEKALAEAIKKQKAKAGIAIVADPATGKILAVANIDKTKKSDKFWGLSQTFEPASMIKGLVAAQAIENGVSTAQAKHNCENGSYKYGDQVYHDWKTGGWPELSTEETLTNSSNICAMKIGEKVGAQGLRKMLSNFGFGPEGSSKNFPAAKAGILPPQEDSKSPKIIPYVSSGFGFQTSPLEMVQAYGAIANGGTLMKPIAADANESSKQVVRRVLSEESAAQSREILRQVVLKGTGKRAASALYSTAGKTSSGFIPDLTQWDLVEGKKRANFAGFIGFAPVNNPRVEVYVGIFDPDTNTGGAHGGEHAAPVFKTIAEGVLKHMNVAPDKKAM